MQSSRSVLHTQRGSLLRTGDWPLTQSTTVRACAKQSLFLSRLAMANRSRLERADEHRTVAAWYYDLRMQTSEGVCMVELGGKSQRLGMRDTRARRNVSGGNLQMIVCRFLSLRRRGGCIWNKKMNKEMVTLGFTRLKCEYCLYFCQTKDNTFLPVSSSVL